MRAPFFSRPSQPEHGAALVTVAAAVSAATRLPELVRAMAAFALCIATVLGAAWAVT